MKKSALVVGLLGLTALVVADSAMATAIVDYSSAVTSAGAEITSSVATATPIFGTIMAIGVGIKIVKKFFKG